jgi:hypothetical protein
VPVEHEAVPVEAQGLRRAQRRETHGLPDS